MNLAERQLKSGVIFAYNNSLKWHFEFFDKIMEN